MPYKRDTPAEIKKRIEADMASASPAGDVKLRWSVESVFAGAIAMVAHLIYGYIDWLSRQILPDTADDEFMVRHANIWSLTKKGATNATGPVIFTGINGSTVTAGAILKRADDVEYILNADVTIAAGTGTGTVTCQTAGATGNAIAGVKLTLTSPTPGIQSEVTVAAGELKLGVDQERNEALSLRVLERIQQPPHGGAAHDYIAWAKEVAGVTRAWAYPNQYGRGTVGVTFVMDEKTGTIIPVTEEVTTVQNHIDSVRPTGADVTVFAPTAVPVNFEINITPNTEAVRAAIAAEIADLFQREAQPGGTLYISRLREAVSIAAGEYDHVLVAPAANVVMDFGQMPVVGSYTWDTV